MSKAFDRADPTMLAEDMSNIIEDEDLCLINIILDTELTIRYRNKDERKKTF